MHDVNHSSLSFMSNDVNAVSAISMTRQHLLSKAMSQETEEREASAEDLLLSVDEPAPQEG